MDTPAAQAAEALAKKMTIKRTTFSPWTAKALRGSARSTASQSPGAQQQKPAPKAAEAGGEPAPANIVSDVLPSTETATPQQLQPPPPKAKPTLASNAQILKAQARWEKSTSGDRASRASSTGTDASTGSDASSVPAVLPAAPTQANASVARQTLPNLKPDSPASTSRAMPRKRTSETSGPDAKRSKVTERTASPAVQSRKGSDAGLQQAMHEARAAVDKQLSSVQNNAIPETRTKHKTGGELLAHIRRTLGQSSPAESANSSVSPVNEEVSSRFPHSQPEIISHAPDGREYDLFIDEEGKRHYFKGAIFPMGYAKRDHQSLRFPCPVRGCGSFLPKLESLRAHFGHHRASTFQDNGDGTISRVGSYSNAPGTSSPAVIVSVTEAARLKAAAGTKKPETPVPLPQLGPQASTDVKGYLQGLLAPQQPVPDRPDVRHMVQLKKQRDLPGEWLRHHRGKKLDGTLYATALAYITGDEITNRTRCIRGIGGGTTTARLSGKCIAPPDMPTVAKEVFSKVPTCVGCKYWCTVHRQSNQCNWARNDLPESDTDYGGEEDNENEASNHELLFMDLSGKPIPAPWSLDSEPPPETNERDESPLTSIAKMNEVVSSTKASPARMVERLSASDRAAVPLEMEEWEFAPGRKVDASTSETIAMSSAYQTSNQPIAVSEDVGINDIVVERGRSYQWLPEKDKLRICYIATGKVLVKMGGETFRQGPNSSLVIRPGKTCKVENRFYVDAVLHCTTIKDYEVAEV